MHQVVFQRFTTVAARLLRAPVSLVSLLHEDGTAELPRDLQADDLQVQVRLHEFCAHAILVLEGGPEGGRPSQSDEPLIVLDTKGDERLCSLFAQGEAPGEEPGVGFFVGAPLRSEDGVRLGTLCVLDFRARAAGEFEDEDWWALRNLAACLASKVALRREEWRLNRENAWRRSVEEALRQSERRLSMALEAGRMGVWELDVRAGRVSLSDTLERILGLEPGGFGGSRSDFVSLVHPQDRGIISRAMNQFFETGIDPQPEFRVLKPDGQVLEIEGRSHLVRGEEGQPRRLVGLLMDVTARKQSERALQAAHDDLESRVRKRTLDLARANEVLQAEIHEREEAQSQQKALVRGLEAVLEAADELLLCPDIDSLTEHAVGLARARLGLERCSIFLLEPDAQQPTSAGEQSSEAPRGAQAGEEADGVPALARWRGSFGTDMEGRTTDERSWRGHMGWDDWNGDPFEAVQRPGSQTSAQGSAELMAEPALRWRVREKTVGPGEDGYSEQYGPGTIWQAVTPIASQRGVIGILFNDTSISRSPFREARQELASVFCSLLGGLIDRLRVIEELRDSEGRFRFLADAVPDFVWTSNPDGIPDYYNKRFLEYHGTTLPQVLEQGWQPTLFPEDAERAVRVWARSIQTGEPYEIEYRFRDRHNGGFRWFLGRAEPQRDASGAIIKWFGTGTDIHDRRLAEETVRQALDALSGAHAALQRAHAELEDRVRERTHELARSNALLQIQIAETGRAESRLARHAQELERSNRDLQQFAYVASHDLQEPVRTMASYIQLVERRYGEHLDDRGRLYISHAIDGAHRMQRLINDLLSFARVDSRGNPFETVSCEALLRDVERSLRLSIQESGAQITHDALPTIQADPGQMAQLFQNLLANALKYQAAEPPRVHISAQKLPAEQSRAEQESQEQNEGEQSSGEWLFSVRDNGQGIAPEHWERIFVIFQRLHTRDEYSGTGIGLAICKKIIERHGGRIWVQSQPGQGATFFFTLPDAQKTKTSSQDREAQA